MSSGQGLPFPPQLLAGFPGMQGPGMGFLGPLANAANLQSLLSPEVMQQFQQVPQKWAKIAKTLAQRKGLHERPANSTWIKARLKDTTKLAQAFKSSLEAL